MTIVMIFACVLVGLFIHFWLMTVFGWLMNLLAYLLDLLLHCLLNSLVYSVDPLVSRLHLVFVVSSTLFMQGSFIRPCALLTQLQFCSKCVRSMSVHGQGSDEIWQRQHIWHQKQSGAGPFLSPSADMIRSCLRPSSWAGQMRVGWFKGMHARRDTICSIHTQRPSPLPSLL